MPNKHEKAARMKRNPLHAFDYDPKAFSRYRPSKLADLDEKGIAALASHIRRVCDLDDENAFVLLLRFGFGVACDVIRDLMEKQRSVHGVCEAFRFGCQRYLITDTAISDKSMMAAFQLAMRDYEIIFFHRNRGICWMRRTGIHLDLDATTLRQALVYARCRSFIHLEDHPPEDVPSATLDHWHTRKLAKYIVALPMEFGSILLLRYYCGLDTREIELQTGTRYARGKIEYFRRLFSRRMELDYPVSDQALCDACQLVVRELQIV